MIITLDKAKEFNPKITQEELDGIEKSIRKETNNPFQNLAARFHQLIFEDENKIKWLGEQYGKYLQECIEIRESYNQEQKNLKALANK